MKDPIKRLKEGVMVVLTKTCQKQEKQAFVHIRMGDKRSGTLSTDLAIDKSILFIESPHRRMSILKSVQEKNGSLSLETEVDIFSIRIVEDPNDEEFKKYLSQ